MSENIVKKIRDAEFAATGMIEDARRRAERTINLAKKRLEDELTSFDNCVDSRLKKFREEKVAVYEIEAGQMRKDGEKSNSVFEEKLEKAAASIEKEVKVLAGKELCL